MAEKRDDNNGVEDNILHSALWKKINKTLQFDTLILNHKGKILFKSSDFSEQEIFHNEGISLLDRIVHKKCGEDNCAFRNFLNGEESEYSEQINLQNEKIIKVSGSSIVEQNQKLFILSIQDITDMHKMELILKNSERRLRSYLDASPDIFITINNKGVIKSLHSKNRELNILKGNYIEKHIDDVLFIDNLDEIKHAISFAYESGKTLQIFRSQWIDDTESKRLEIRIVPGGSRDIVLLLRNITELYEKEESIKILEHNSSFVDIASGMSHEMLNNLQSISNYARFLLKDETGKSHSTYIKKIEEISDVTGTLLQNLFTFSSSEKEDPQKINLKESINKAVEYCRFGLKNNIVLHYEPAPDSWVYVPFKQMTGMIINLIMNSREAIEDNGHIFIRCTERVLQYGDRTRIRGSWSDGVFFQVTVEDDGIGMDEDTIAKIFNPLFSTKSSNGSTGMGLTILKRFINEILGGLEITSTPGKGTAFHLYIPSIEQRMEANEKKSTLGTSVLQMDSYNDEGPVVIPESAIELLEGNEDLYQTICRDFILDYGNAMENIEEHLRGEEIDKARITVHSIKGLAGLIGSHFLQEEARVFEDVLKNKDLHGIDEKIHSFGSVLLRVLDELDQYIILREQQDIAKEKKSQIIEITVIDSHQKNELVQLRNHLVYSEYNQAIDCLERLERDSLKSDWKQAVLTMNEWVKQFNFKKTEDYIDQILTVSEAN